MARVQSNGIKLSGAKGGLTNESKRREAFERLTLLEGAYAKLISAVNESFQKVARDAVNTNQDVLTLDRFLGSLMEVLGSDINDKVRELVKSKRIAELEAEAETQTQQVKVLVAEGKLKAMDTVSDENSFMVVTQRDETGNPKHPVRQHASLEQFEPAVKELLVGKKVGETLTLPTGGTVEILECYRAGTPASPEGQDATTEATGDPGVEGLAVTPDPVSPVSPPVE
jgi:hypothetical protein